MSSKSLNNFHPALNLFFYSMKRSMGLTVLVTVFLLLICPGYILLYLSDVTNAVPVYNFNNMMPSVMCFVTAATSAAAVVNLFINFSFLYSRKSSDLFNSLPVTRGGMLFSRFFASTVPQLTPLVLTYASMCGIIMLDEIEGSFTSVFAGFGYNILIILMCCAFTLLFIVCAGSVADLIISFFTYNFGVLLVVLFVNSMCRSLLAGYAERMLGSWFYAFSPFVYAFANQLMMFEESYTMARPEHFAIRLILVTVISFLISYFLYSRRKSEKSGISYAYRFIYIICALIIGFIGGFGLGSIFAGGEYGVTFWIFAAVGAVLAAVTFGAISDRGFKTVKRSAVTGLCAAGIIGVSVLILELGGFGFTSRIPEKTGISSATVGFGGISVDFSDPSQVLALHSAVAESGEEKSEGDYGYLALNYDLKNGKTFCRRFYIDYNEFSDYLLGIVRSEENISGIREELESFADGSLWISEYNYNGYSGTESIENVYITAAELEKITEAYTEDLKNAGMDSVLRANIIEYSIDGYNKEGDHMYSTIYVEEGFTKTKEVIASLKLSERVAPEN